MYKLSEQAAADFADIYDYTLLTFGVAQADHYATTLEAFLETLAGMPSIGRDYSAVPGVMRVEFHRHSVFYVVCDADILIARILHQQMNHPRHFQ